MSLSMSTFAGISCYTFILCLILGAAEYFMRLCTERGWGSHLPDFIVLMAVWAGYVWLSNLFSSRIIHFDEYDMINLSAIALVCVSVVLFRGKMKIHFIPELFLNACGSQFCPAQVLPAYRLYLQICGFFLC